VQEIGLNDAIEGTWAPPALEAPAEQPEQPEQPQPPRQPAQAPAQELE
jgi:hypothetical protein